MMILAVAALLASLSAGAPSPSVPADNAPTVNSAQPSAGADASEKPDQPKKTLTACGALRGGNTHYVLANDVQSTGTCFSIGADDVTLDLNQHSITYGTAGDKLSFGVLAVDCWDKSIAPNPCDGGHRHAVIENGKIIQGAGAAPMSHAIRFGQALNMTGIVVHDVDITVGIQDSIAIYGEYLPGGSDIYRNTIHNNVKVVSNRHQFRGMSIKLDGEADAKLPDLVHDNTIIGGAQGGIRVENGAGTRIFRNDISQDATYTNGFCIDASGAGTQVYLNKCHPTHGRGIHANATGVQIFDNIVDSIDSDKNEEYGGCELNGTYGIQVESDAKSPENIRVYHNQVKVHAAGCPAAAMRLTELHDAAVQIYDNKFIAVQDSIGSELSTKMACGFSVGDVLGERITFTANIVQADGAIFCVDWDGSSSIKMSGNTFKAGVHGGGTLLANFGNGMGPSQEHFFADNVIEGFSPSSVKFGEYSGDSWLDLGSSLTLHLKDQNGRAVAGAEAQISGPWGHSANGVSDAQGDAKLLVPSLRLESKQPPKKISDYSLIVTRQGCETLRFALTQPLSQSVSRSLNCQQSGN